MRVLAAGGAKINRPQAEAHDQYTDAAGVVDAAGRNESFDQSGDYQHAHASKLDHERVGADVLQSRAAAHVPGRDDRAGENVACRCRQTDRQ